MKLLLDENLSDRIISQIVDLFPDSTHTKAVGKEFKLLHFASVIIENLNRPNPLLSLAVINLSQIQNRLLDNAIGSATPIFHPASFCTMKRDHGYLIRSVN